MDFYIDNEVPFVGDPPTGFGEWDDRVQVGGSTIIRTPDAAWPERGAAGLRVSVSAAGEPAAMVRSQARPLAPGQWAWWGAWVRPHAPAANYVWAQTATVSSWDGRLRISAAGAVQLRVRCDDGVLADGAWSPPLAPARWTYLAWGVRRSTDPSGADPDGEAALYVDGVETARLTGLGNHDRWAALAELQLGCPDARNGGLLLDLDELKACGAYPEPFAPPPVGDYVDARRTCVLYRPGSADSTAFADHCVEAVGVPRANLVPLPDASGDELLDGAPAFRTQIEDAIDAYFARNPTVAGRCGGFLVGFDVPGGFHDGGVVVSATARLARYGSVYAGPRANPLYVGDGVVPSSRPTAGELRTAGVYLCSRVDGADLPEAVALLDRSVGLAVSEGALLRTDDSAYAASRARQHLRIAPGPLGVGLTGDAFLWRIEEPVTFGASGGRAVCGDLADGSAGSLRAPGAACRDALLAGYAAAFGWAGPSGAAPSPEAFFEVLRLGGTLAEAALLACPELDGGAVLVGSPLLAPDLPRAGFDLYLAEGDVNACTSPVAHTPPGGGEVDLPASLQPGRSYVLAARAVSAAGVAEHNTHVVRRFRVDESGELRADLAPPVDLAARPRADGTVCLEWTAAAEAGRDEPTGFEVVSDGGSGSFDDAVALVCVPAEPGRSEYQAAFDPGPLPARLAVRAVAGGAAGPLRAAVLLPAPNPLHAPQAF